MTGQAFDPGRPVDYAWAGEFLERYVTARTEFNVSPFVDLFGEDAVLQPDPFEPAVTGTNEIRAYLLRCGDKEAEVEVTIERHWVSGSTIFAAWHASFVRRPDGGHVREAGFLTAEMRSGRCSRFRTWSVTKPEGH